MKETAELFIGTIFSVMVFVAVIVYLFYSGWIAYHRIKDGRKFVPFVPADKNGRKAIIREIIGLKLPQTAKIIDLGSGTGDIVRAIAMNFKNLVTGVEYNPALHYIAVLLSKLSGIKNAKYVLGDIRNIDLSNYSLITTYLFPEFIRTELIGKFTKELKKGSTVISYVFQVEELTKNGFSEAIKETGNKGWNSKLFIYQKMR